MLWYFVWGFEKLSYPVSKPCIETYCRFFMRSFPSSWGAYKKICYPPQDGSYWERSSFIKRRNLGYDFLFLQSKLRLCKSVVFLRQEDWQMTNWISPLRFTALHRCWIISIGWIVFMLLSGKTLGIGNRTRYTQCLIISPYLIKILQASHPLLCQRVAGRDSSHSLLAEFCW